MRCEIIAVGTELLLGQIVDTNSSWMGEHLALAGIDSHYQTKVGDNLGRMVSCIRIALGRADAVILCGGLGPTQDDITREAIAEVMGVGLLRDENVVERIRAMFEARGRVMTDNNRRQADVPEGAVLIAEMPGTAPGLVCPIGAQVIYAVPGVPHEMREMLEGTVIPDLERRAGVTSVIRSRVLRTWGQSESGLAEMLVPRMRELDALGNPTLAFQASGIEGIKVRITVKAGDDDEARRILAAEEVVLRAVLGDIVFATDDDNMEHAVTRLLRARGARLAVAETVTGGLMADRLSQADPRGEVFVGAVASPAPAPALGLDRAPERSQAGAAALADAVRERFGVEYGLASIDAGAAHAGDLPPGTVHLAVSGPDATHAATVHLPGDRRRIRLYSVISALDLLRRHLAEPRTGRG